MFENSSRKVAAPSAEFQLMGGAAHLAGFARSIIFGLMLVFYRILVFLRYIFLLIFRSMTTFG